MIGELAITGTGAVSPAGWGAPALADALLAGHALPTATLDRPPAIDRIATTVRRVPGGGTPPKHARLRRASPISRFAAAAAVEALGESRLAASLAGHLRVGVVFTLTNGCVNYSNRFFGEVCADPAMASPILFPETVFNAPSSHLSAMIGSRAANDSLIGDASAFISGIDLAAEWLERGEVDGCLVVAAEELDWLSAEALCLYHRDCIPAEGAAAIYLEPAAGPVALHRLPDPLPFNRLNRAAAAQALRDEFEACNDGTTLLVDGLTGIKRLDHPECAAWAGWRGPRWSPKTILGDAVGAAAALQVVAAAQALNAGICPQAVVSAIGSNQQAAGLLLGR